MARPTKLTPHATERIVAAIKNGSPAQDAAALCGIASTTYYRWMREGADGDDPAKREFRQRVIEAKAQLKAACVRQVLKASSKDWKAAAWYLERCHPDEFGRRDRVRVDGEQRVKVEVTAQQRLDKIMADPTIAQIMEAVVGSSSTNGGQGERPGEALRASAERQ